MAWPLFAAYAAATAASMAMQSRASKQAMEANAAQARYQAQLAEKNAQLDEEYAAEQAAQIRRYGQREVAADRVRYAKAGVRLEGTPLDVLVAKAADIETHALNSEIAGRTSASMRRWGGEFAYAQGRMRGRQMRSEFYAGLTSKVARTAGAAAGYF